MREDFITELENQLVEAKIHFGFNFIVEKLFSEDEERVHGRIVVQIHRIENVSKYPVESNRDRIEENRCFYSIIGCLCDSRMWSARIHGIDISMGN